MGIVVDVYLAVVAFGVGRLMRKNNARFHRAIHTFELTNDAKEREEVCSW